METPYVNLREWLVLKIHYVVADIRSLLFHSWAEFLGVDRPSLFNHLPAEWFGLIKNKTVANMHRTFYKNRNLCLLDKTQ